MLVTQDFVFLSNGDSIEVSRIAAEGAETLTPTLLIFSAALLRTTDDAALVLFQLLGDLEEEPALLTTVSFSGEVSSFTVDNYRLIAAIDDSYLERIPIPLV